MNRLALSFLWASALCLAPFVVYAQGLDPSSTLASANSWPTYSGDYSGRHYSTLEQINQANVKNLALAWVSHITVGTALPNETGFGGPAAATPTIVGGETTQDIKVSGSERRFQNCRRDTAGQWRSVFFHS